MTSPGRGRDGGLLRAAALREGKVRSLAAACGGITQSPYVIVADADAVWRRARENGAEIVLDIKDETCGGRGFSCWNLGTYDPWSLGR